VFWTTAQIAEATGLSQRHVGHLLRHGVIAGYKAGHDWIIQEAEAQRFIKEYNENKEQFERQEDDE
jgi:excisionase family DNA binding protein